jgi:murein DD-endopeptidase MepM/ murein hydrolase activator NlpD
MKKKKEKTTILLVNKSAHSLKPFQISTRLIRNWKKYIAALTFLFISLIAIVIYLAYNNFQQHRQQQILANKLRSAHNLIADADTATVRKKMQAIDKELSDINGFLKARGIRNEIKLPQGGEEEDAVISNGETVNFYEKYLNRIGYDISHTPLGMPFSGAVTSSFGHRENPFGGADVEIHRGMDISGPMGAPVKSVAKGRVAFAGVKGGFGNCIIINHENGFETLYGHLSKILVRKGQQIDIGEQIGNIGSTGRSTGPHLHYEVHRNGQKMNPQSFLTL